MANDRVGQLPVEVVALPTDALARVGQLPVEVGVLPTDALARVGQLPVEVIVHNPINYFERTYATIID